MRVPFADQGLNKIPDGVTDRQTLLVGDVLATGYWAARISEISEQDTVLIIGVGPTGICTLLSVMLKKPRRIIVCEKDENRLQFIQPKRGINLQMRKNGTECILCYECTKICPSKALHQPFFLICKFSPRFG